MDGKFLEEGKNNEFIKSIIELEYYPVSRDENRFLEAQTKIPMSKISALGTAFEPLLNISQNIVGKDNLGTGLWVTVPQGRTLADLAKFKDGRGYLGSVLKDGKVGGGQAVLNPIVFNPTMLFLAAALINIDQKLDRIEEIQEEILNFLIQKERSELKGNLNFLMDILKNYKYNWDNEKYKRNNHIVVLDIKKDSEGKIDFYKKGIMSKITKRVFIRYNRGVEKEMMTIEDEFKDYQLSLYLFAFSSFLEIILLENYNSQYLQNIGKKIDEYSFEYRELYSQSFSIIESNSENSVEGKLLRLVSNLSNKAGESMNRIPVIKKSNIEKHLKKVGNQLEVRSNKGTEKLAQIFIERHNSHVSPFIEKINHIDNLYNNPVQIYFDI